ncbi:tRNA epoxyqueuosine(34) reductase QueG [Candidatus Rariloculus sp.]|uniref:tRNA epoxyqueuosine(34) reductase QueG n=1 Tax=Candidatus Rariloculus sp. TaxID=3101265 RepID=UPI003D1144BC
MTVPATTDWQTLSEEIKQLGRTLGFDKIGIAGIDLAEDEARLERWLALKRNGEMQYMAQHGRKRSRPAELVPGTVRVITVRMDYWPSDCADAQATLDDKRQGYISRYALGRDYHKVLRRRLRKLAGKIEDRVGPTGYRVFVDSAPVLEKALARNAGLGWIGKHTNLIDRTAGSWFFLGELFTDLPLPADRPVQELCGSCTACLDLCPTGAIVAPYEVDARRCISYLTIELKGSIPEEFRAAIGNRIFGCDDCQLVCPWNKYAQRTTQRDFAPRHGLDSADLIELFGWTENEWASRTEGSALRRAGYAGWLRNVAVALGNAPTSSGVVKCLRNRANHESALVREHVAWALAQHGIH